MFKLINKENSCPFAGTQLLEIIKMYKTDAYKTITGSDNFIKNIA